MALGSENCPNPNPNLNSINASLRLLYQVKGDAITKHPDYQKAAQLLAEMTDDNSPSSVTIESINNLNEQLASKQKELEQLDQDIEFCSKEAQSDQVEQMMNFDLSNLEHRVEQVKGSVDQLNRNIQMMRNSFVASDRQKILQIDEARLEKANVLVDNLLKVFQRD